MFFCYNLKGGGSMTNRYTSLASLFIFLYIVGLSFLRYLDVVSVEITLILIVLLFIIFYLLVVLVSIDEKRKSIKPKDMVTKICDLDFLYFDENWEEFRQITHVYYYDKYQANSIKFKLEIEKTELLIDVIRYESPEIILKNRLFLDKAKSDPDFYNKAIIMSVYYLINGSTDLFTSVYGHFIDTVQDRPEFRIFHEQFYDINIYNEVISIDKTLLDMFHNFYNNQIDISDTVDKYLPKNRLHELIYVYAFYYYAKHIEDEKLVDDIKTEMDRLKELRMK